MRHGLSNKRKKIKKREDPWRSKWKNGHMNIQERKKNIAMSLCYPNQGERFIKGVFHFHHPFSIHVHNIDQLVWFVISMDPLFDFIIYVTHVHFFYLPWAPHKLSLEVGWKETMLWWAYIHTERHERSYEEVKLWLVFEKIFSRKNPVIW